MVSSSQELPASSLEPGVSIPNVESEPPKDIQPLDILFLQDATGSQGPYIKAARSAIQDICEKISQSTALSQSAIRFGLIAFRDHPPQDMSYVTKNFDFTSDVSKMKTNLASLIATGGGDGPEAQTAALAEALNMEWAESAVKIVVLITDSPPHGIGEGGDGFLKSPDQNDPLDVVRQMAERGITLYVIACEPALSREYKHAVDFYRALCQITSGRMVPLLNASQLGDLIIGSAVETIETEKLIGEFEHVILEDVYRQGKPVEEVMQTIQQQMTDRNVQINTLTVENAYEDTETSKHNTNIWTSAESIGSARGKTKPSEPGSLNASYPTATPFSFGGLWGSAGPSAASSPKIDYAGPFGAPLSGLRKTPPGSATFSGPGVSESSGRTPTGLFGAPRSPMVSPPGSGLFGSPSTFESLERAPASLFGFGSLSAKNPTASLFGAPQSAATEVPPPMQQQMQQQQMQMQALAQTSPGPMLMSQAVDMSQTKRVVMKSLMRNAKVGPGNVLTPTGEYATENPAPKPKPKPSAESP